MLSMNHTAIYSKPKYILMIVLLLSTTSCSRVTVPPERIANLPNPQTPAPFKFLIEPGPINEAMKSIWEQWRIAPETTQEARASMQKVTSATVIIQQNLSQAQAILLDSIQHLYPDDYESYRSLVPLFQIVGDNEPILEHFHSILMDIPKDTEPIPHGVFPTAELVRQSLSDQLMYHAQNGSEKARDLIFDLVRSPDPTTQATAVRYYYRLVPNRYMAQRKMRSLMAPESRYLLYIE